VFSLLKKNGSQCTQLRESLEELTDERSLPETLAAHMASCRDCKAALEELFASRALLGAIPRQSETAAPWFTARVMATIAERENQMERSLETWTVLPKLASKLAWVCAVALMLTSPWLVGGQKTVPVAQVRVDLTGEPVVENHPVPVDNDEVLTSLTETKRME
jgi:hypothetical protein